MSSIVERVLQWCREVRRDDPFAVISAGQGRDFLFRIAESTNGSEFRLSGDEWMELKREAGHPPNMGKWLMDVSRPPPPPPRDTTWSDSRAGDGW